MKNKNQILLITLLVIFSSILFSKETSKNEFRDAKYALNGEWKIRKEFKIKNKNRLSKSELNQIINSKLSFVSNHLIFRNDTIKLKDKNLELLDLKKDNVLDKEFKIDLSDINKLNIDTLESAYIFKFKSKQNNSKYNLMMFNNKKSILFEYKNMLFQATKIYNFEN